VRRYAGVLGVVLVVILGLWEDTASAQQCRSPRTNAQGVAMAPVIVGASATVVLDAVTTRCQGIVQNEQGAGDVRCAWDTETPTSTAGFLLAAGQSVVFGNTEQKQLRCIRTGTTDGKISTWEAMP